MPVPPALKEKYGTLVAVETTRLKGQGMDPTAANTEAKKVVDNHFRKSGQMPKKRKSK